MQIKMLYLLIIFQLLDSCKNSSTQLNDGFYFNEKLGDFLIIKEGGKKQEIYDITVNTSFKNDTLKYDCAQCPFGETVLKLTQEKNNILISSAYKKAPINNKIFKKIDVSNNTWDSIRMCSDTNCITFYSNYKDNQLIRIGETPMTLMEELNLISYPDFSLISSSTDNESMEIIIFFKNKDKVMKKTQSLFLYFRNLRYLVYNCLVDRRIGNREVLNCNFKVTKKMLSDFK